MTAITFIYAIHPPALWSRTVLTHTWAEGPKRWQRRSTLRPPNKNKYNRHTGKVFHPYGVSSIGQKLTTVVSIATPGSRASAAPAWSTQLSLQLRKMSST